ncbi:hypothetical protein [Pseudorhodoplanes sp.]|uniref:hypothetical protein n=1 Tax=Pseudorhodoplanes sp. TaxID=1934341 RepID=UPI0039190526
MLPDRTRRDGEAPRAAAPFPDEQDRRDLAVVNTKQTTPAGKPSRYGDALFVAHLFASKFDVPQQRDKRRADPADANTSYRNSATRPAAAGRVLSKKV